MSSSFPGTWSDCDFHSRRLRGPASARAVRVASRARSRATLDCVILPGRLLLRRLSARRRAWRDASPVVDALARLRRRVAGWCSGSCNGFQILCEAGLLPGVLTRNECLQYRCQSTPPGRRERRRRLFTRGLRVGQVADDADLARRGKVLRRRRDASRQLKRATPDRVPLRDRRRAGHEGQPIPNGSLDNIAGIVNPEGTVLGHDAPSRAGGRDGRWAAPTGS